MKKVLVSVFSLVLILSLASMGIADDCSSKGTRTADKKSSDCSGEKATTVADAKLMAVKGKLVNCKQTLSKVAESKGMCPKGVHEDGKALLVENADGKHVLVAFGKKLELPESVVKIKAKGKMKGGVLHASKLSGFCTKSEKWHDISLETKKAEL